MRADGFPSVACGFLGFQGIINARLMRPVGPKP